MTVVKIHGTSGAGKTTIVRNIMDEATEVVPIGPLKRPEAYRVTHPRLKIPLYILGSYENKCGGMDSVSEVENQIKLILAYAECGHVLYEGLLLSTYYGRPGAAVAHMGWAHVWAFLNTPIEVCIERVKARRMARGVHAPLNEHNTRAREVPIRSLRKKLYLLSKHVVDIQWDADPTDQVLRLFEESDNA
jgi:hypothetical protein